MTMHIMLFDKRKTGSFDFFLVTFKLTKTKKPKHVFIKIKFDFKTKWQNED